MEEFSHRYLEREFHRLVATWEQSRDLATRSEKLTDIMIELNSEFTFSLPSEFNESRKNVEQRA